MHTQGLLIILLSTAVCFIVAQGTRVCGNVPVWRNENATCPRRAVCADVFTTDRDWLNGTTCQEQRVLYNCLCPGDEICPINNENHRFYVTRTQSSYTCEPRCSIGWCGDNRARTSANGRRVDPLFPQTLRHNAPEFNYHNYYRMDCRCPRHHVPDTSPGIHRAVQVYSHRYDFQDHIFITLYNCDYGRSQGIMEDPCRA